METEAQDVTDAELFTAEMGEDELTWRLRCLALECGAEAARQGILTHKEGGEYINTIRYIYLPRDGGALVELLGRDSESDLTDEEWEQFEHYWILGAEDVLKTE